MPTYYKISSDTLTAIADAVRSKTGVSDAIPCSELAAVIESIPTGSGFTSFSRSSGILLVVPKGAASSYVSLSEIAVETSASGKQNLEE